MPLPGHHAMLPRPDHDEAARMDFVFSFKEHVTKEVATGTKAAFDRRVGPTIARTLGHEARNRHEVHKHMRRDPYWQLSGSLSRLYQELKQEVGESVAYRHFDELRGTARELRATARHSTLRLNPDLAIPRYQSAVDIHLMPGSYYTDRTEDDVTAGAIYDPGVYMFAMGSMGPYNEDMGLAVIKWINIHRPGFKPRRILDMGCAVGHCTLPYAKAFPEAEIHAIDIGAPVLRYAHARAESLGCAIHFSQQNAEATNFPDGHFDLIVSHILLHETSHKAIYTIMRECRRLLADGGLVLHGDVPFFNQKLDPFTEFTRDWSTHYNAEPFWGTLHDMDLVAPAVEAGFARDSVILDNSTAGSAPWMVYGASR
jgi:2-polyprenyl-3-methyl-5-hydroxy-6-metoxy-1,4-benzoquinol methylase